jgi:SAM-dependent methyltransferase
MTHSAADETRTAVREHYGKVAENSGARGCAPGCCASSDPNASLSLGYSAEELALAPEGANLGLGCGNPHAIASMGEGETVLDLGSGAGFDCFLAAQRVGAKGRVIGVDMTPEMIAKARANAGKVGATNVEFRLGEIEHLPLADASVDVVLSNCVINLSPSKAEVFREAFRVLRAGGRVAISDVLATRPIPAHLRSTELALASCVGGAIEVGALEQMLISAGFSEIRITPRPESRAFIEQWLPGSGAEDYIVSATIEARKAVSSKSCCGPACCTPGAGQP